MKAPVSYCPWCPEHAQAAIKAAHPKAAFVPTVCDACKADVVRKHRALQAEGLAGAGGGTLTRRRTRFPQRVVEHEGRTWIFHDPRLNDDREAGNELVEGVQAALKALGIHMAVRRARLSRDKPENHKEVEALVARSRERALLPVGRGRA